MEGKAERPWEPFQKKNLKKGWEEVKDLERALGDQDMAQRGSG